MPDARIHVETGALQAHAAQIGGVVGELEAVIARYQAAADDLESQVTTMKSKVAALAPDFTTSSASVAYNDLMAKWDQRANSIHTALEELKTGSLTPMTNDLTAIKGSVASAAGSYDDTEQGVKGLFGR